MIISEAKKAARKVPDGAQHPGWWDGPERYQGANRNIITAAQRDILFDTVAALAPGPIGWDMGGPGFDRNGLYCKGLNIVNGNHLTCDAMDVPFEDNSVDYIISSHALEHMTDTRKALREWIRVLKPNGLMAIIMPDKDYFEHDNENPEIEQCDLAPCEMTANEMQEVLKDIEGLEILLFNTHQNYFDFNILARKRTKGGNNG